MFGNCEKEYLVECWYCVLVTVVSTFFFFFFGKVLFGIVGLEPTGQSSTGRELKKADEISPKGDI